MSAGEKEKKHLGHIQPYSPQSGTMVPMGAQKFFRTCVLWQLVRFVVINFRMTILILKSHH
ncbi:MAG: hypothetical protein U9N49_01375 [Campylobacterota bacterium]|nr:hypothetical protein [Campylobacterota bacterium]